MAAVGIDFGTASSVLAVARKRGIDTIINEVSNRSTPSFVSFSEKQRFLGEPAINQQIMNFKNTVGYMKALLGRKFKEEAAQTELKRLVNRVEELPDGEIGIHVMYKNEDHVFTPLQLTAMFFQKLKLITEKELGRELVDVVISVPGHWTHHRRQALFEAAKIAGLNCLRLINDTTAAALSWGIYQNFPEAEAEGTNVMFVDYGYANVSISLVQFTKGKLKVLSTAHQESGARVFDEALFDYFAKKVEEKYKVDVRTMPKSRKKLEVACDRLKKMLTINSEGPLNVENILEDRDYSAQMKREEFEELIQPHLNTLQSCFDQVLKDSGLSREKIHSVEVVGSGWRPPAVVRAIETFTGKPLSKTLNQPEAVARGCALQCAMISPTFKVRDFAVKDYYPYSVRAEWQFLNSMSDTSNQGELFKKGQEIPSRRNITMSRVESVEVVASYSDQPELPTDAPKLVGRWKVDVPTAQGEDAQLKIKLKLNESGLVELLGAELSESSWVEETVTPATPPPAAPAPDAANTNEPMDTSGAEPAAQAESVPQPEKKRKKITKTSSLPIQSSQVGTPAHVVQTFRDEELKMDADDKLVAETLEKKNELESLCINLRQQIGSDHKDFSTEKERSELSKLAETLEEWLYNDGEDETKSVYVEKINQIRKLGDPILARKREAEIRTENFEKLKEFASQLVASLADPKYDHLEAADKDSIIKEVQTVLDDITVKFNTQEAAPKHQDPTFKSTAIPEKIKHLETFSRPILNKPKPKPVEETPPPTPQQPEQTPTTPEAQPSEQPNEPRSDPMHE